VQRREHEIERNERNTNYKVEIKGLKGEQNRESKELRYELKMEGNLQYIDK